jgi:Domain of unknown function (DUF3859)
MRNRRRHLPLLVALLVFVLAARTPAAEAKTEGAPRGKVVEFGVTKSSGEEHLRPNPDALDGQQATVRGGPKFTAHTTFVPAKLGVSFGLGFLLSGIDETGSVELKKIVKHPRMKNAKGEEEDQYTMTETRPVRNGSVSAGAGYSLDRLEELKPGLWTFEIWYRDKKLISQSFTVYDEAGMAAADPGKAPTEFVPQVLEPTGGKIQRPKSWFYSESHDEVSYTWILSREDASKGPYITGMRIQTLVGVQKGTGKSPRQFVLDYVETKRKEVKVLKKCDRKNQGMFTRLCLETEEGPFHIQYSLFWGNKVDIVVVCIAGTTKELWGTYAETFDRIGHFDLIDLKRFEK